MGAIFAFNELRASKNTICPPGFCQMFITKGELSPKFFNTNLQCFKKRHDGRVNVILEKNLNAALCNFRVGEEGCEKRNNSLHRSALLFDRNQMPNTNFVSSKKVCC